RGRGSELDSHNTVHINLCELSCTYDRIRESACKVLHTWCGADGVDRRPGLTSSLLPTRNSRTEAPISRRTLTERRRDGESHGCQDSVCKSPASAGFSFSARSATRAKAGCLIPPAHDGRQTPVPARPQ